MKTILAILCAIFAVVGAVAYKLCIPATLVLVACKIWYAPYSWSWLATILVPLGCGALGFVLCVLIKIWVEKL